MTTATGIPGAFPLRAFKRGLYHVGTMNRMEKRAGSHEGAGLSVSTEPDAWERINRGHTTGTRWELTRPGNRFLNFHRLTKLQRQAISDWGIKQGFVIQGTLYRHSWMDGDLDQVMFTDYTTREEADAEFAGMDEEGSLEQVPGLVATDKLRKRVEEETIPLGFVFDLLATMFAEDVLKVDGVWWQDRLDVPAYSAPRGVIFNAMLPAWRREMVKS